MIDKMEIDIKQIVSLFIAVIMRYISHCLRANLIHYYKSGKISREFPVVNALSFYEQYSFLNQIYFN